MNKTDKLYIGWCAVQFETGNYLLHNEDWYKRNWLYMWWIDKISSITIRKDRGEKLGRHDKEIWKEFMSYNYDWMMTNHKGKLIRQLTTKHK